jgi:hypothetical protein
MKALVLIGFLLTSLNGMSGNEPKITKEISRKVKINPERWLRSETESISVEVSFYVQNKTIRIQHIESENDEVKVILEKALEKSY